MDKILNKYITNNTEITFKKIKPFYNICPITEMKEEVNVEIIYKPDKYLLEIGSYREYFNKKFNCYIEELAQMVYNEIQKTIYPKELVVRVYLDEEKLTPWIVKIQ